jgi:hypothetical protein
MKRLLIPLFIALILVAGCLGAGNTPNSGGGLHQVSIESHQIAPTPSEDVMDINRIPLTPRPTPATAPSGTVLSSDPTCGQLVYCGVITSPSISPVTTDQCVRLDMDIRKNHPKIKNCFNIAYKEQGAKELVKYQCSNGLISRTICDKQGVPYTAPAK